MPSLDDFDESLPSHDGLSRRRWLQLMGASLALAGAQGCRWEKADLVPFASQPANRVPGQTLRFATAMDLGGSALGLLVTSVDGRPIKIEGNPKHPASRGATDVFAQASILELYDPDRSRTVWERADPAREPGSVETSRTWDDFARFARPHFAALGARGGQGLRVLAGASSSPTLAALRARLLEALPKAKWYEYEPISYDNEREGTRRVFGKPYRVHLALDRARVIVCLDADPLGFHPEAVRNARDFAQGREVVDGRMSRLYSIESCWSITGSVADHRLPLRSDQVAWFAKTLAMKLAGVRGAAAPPPGGRSDEVMRFLRAVVADLRQHGGQALFVAGPRQPPDAHALVHELNVRQGRVGETIHFTDDPEPGRLAHGEAIARLAEEMGAGEVETLVVLAANPVYDAPADLDFARLFGRVPTRIHLGLYRDETARRSTWHLPQAHWLEAWGDARAYDSTYSIVQPMVDPLGAGHSAIELIALLLGQDAPNGYDLVRDAFKSLLAGGPQAGAWEAAWKQTLHDGVLADSRWPAVSPNLTGTHLPPQPAELEFPGTLFAGENGRLEVVFCHSATLYDGRFANNGWLQELADPMTRLTWDNAAILSPETARFLRIQQGTLIRLKYGGREVEMPACVMPGQAFGSVSVALGYGRTAAGKVGGSIAEGVPPVGVNAYLLRTSGAMGFAAGLSIEPTGRKQPLAVTQDHHAIDQVGLRARAERVGQLVREATLEHYRQHPEFARHAVEHPPLESLWEEPKYEGHRWGMAIDLSKCIGCGACVVACQAENNVPVVGKEQVLRGREMHWVRVDRYFQGDTDNPRAVHQVVACHHCETAPCEQVCPVAATVHSHEGLNDMVYNRCVGTRYCANNCPYKVRRFNFFNYHKDLDDPANEVRKMVYNPEVTVRSRGVMEKCTYCVQRIQAVKIAAKSAGRAIADGEVRTACQQVCPAGAIEFGDLADARSRVAGLHAAGRAYAMLAELNVKPRTVYLARIRNPNPRLEDRSDEHARPAG